MPKFMFEASYTAEGIKGVIKEGGTARRATIEKIIENAGGRVEAFYFLFGDADAITIADLPDNAAAAAIASHAGASGAVSVRTRVLLTPEEMDAASERTVDYRPPGA